MGNRIRTVVISVVTVVWAINFIAPVFVKNFSPSPELNVAFMAIIGVLTASYKMDKQQHNNDDKHDDSKPTST